jgi:hypothetical protein
MLRASKSQAASEVHGILVVPPRHTHVLLHSRMMRLLYFALAWVAQLHLLVFTSGQPCVRHLFTSVSVSWTQWLALMHEVRGRSTR